MLPFHAVALPHQASRAPRNTRSPRFEGLNAGRELTQLGHLEVTPRRGRRGGGPHGEGGAVSSSGRLRYDSLAYAVAQCAGHEDVGVLAETIEERSGKLVVSEDAIAFAQGEMHKGHA